MKRNKISILLLSTILTLTGCNIKGKTYDASEYILESPYKDDYKILQLSDIHFANKDNQQLHLDFLKLTIEDANPDMIIATGDLFTFADRITAKRLFRFFDSFEIPWTVTFGNHDEQCYFSIDWLTKHLNTSYKYCLFKDILDDDVFGNANFAINLTKDNKVFEQLIIMDSNRYYYGSDYLGYDYIKEDQIDWYERVVNYTTLNNNNEVVPSLLFFHIPVPEFEIAWNDYQEGKDGVEYVSGGKKEDVCCPKTNSGFFTKIKQLDSTKGIFVGHDHVNDYILKYQGIYLSYGIHSTNRIYYDDSLLGGRTITIHNDHSLSFGSIFHSYQEVI